MSRTSPVRSRSITRIAAGVAVLFASAAAFAATTQPAKPQPAKPLTYSQSVHQQAMEILTQLQSSNDDEAAMKAADALFDQVTLYAPDDQLAAFHDADFAWRITQQLAAVGDDQRPPLLAYLLKNPDLASTLAFLIHGDAKKCVSAYTLLDRLREKHADQLNTYANLTAALCVVRGEPLTVHVNENAVIAADPLALYDYYVKHESQMYFGLKNVPAELLAYVVDTGASIDELEWALPQYAGDKDIGRHFFDIKYDYAAFTLGTEKVVTTKGFSLPNILKYGGVCADQAYYAVTIGKAIGVPTAYTTGAAGEAGHAWVGFLQSDGKHGAWNFNSGRYEAYQGVRGSCNDPQTRASIPDSYVSLLGELITTRPADRQNCIAVADAVGRLRKAMADLTDLSASAPAGVTPGSIRPTPRKSDVPNSLALTELAIRQSAGYAPAWFIVRDMAVDKQLMLADKRHWADLLISLGAKKYPDFALAMLVPMVQSVDDVKAQDALWTNLLPMFKTRFDLSAAIRMEQAAMWEANQQPEKAGLCYMDVVQRYANAGPFIVPALTGAENLLTTTGRGDKVLTLYEQTWASTKEPQKMAQMFLRGSNWYRVGKMYADKLTAAGDDAKAQKVLATIENAGATAASR